jgi:zinc protease
MIQFERYILGNGLKLLVNTDKATPMVTLCIAYQVGTKDEHPERTGFAHLFEHLMFGGSKHAPNFDDAIQRAGGENNAFTNQDMTVYYDIMPLNNLDIALWLEADRMENLILNQRALDVQRKVVVEEFKETCLEEPYGDIWHHIGPLAYQKHPYRVPTIGEKIEHIQEASLDDVAAFFENFYCPNNAVLTISGNISGAEALAKVEQYFGHIKPGAVKRRKKVNEPKQQEKRFLEVEAAVTAPALYMIFQASERQEKDYYLDDLLSDILGDAEASLLFKKLVKGSEIFSEADAYITGTIEQGLFIIEGKLHDHQSFEKAETAIWELLNQLSENPLGEDALQRLQNRIEHNLAFAEVTAFNKALSLSYYEILGDAALINEEGERYQEISIEDLQDRAKRLFQTENLSVIHYKPNAD